MHRDTSIQWRDFQFAKDELIDELRRLVEVQVLHGMAHAVEAWTLVAEDRETAVLAGLEQGELEFGCLALRLIGHTFALPDGTATEVLHIGREDNLETRLIEQFGHVVHERFAGCAEALVKTGREIYHAFVLQPLESVDYAIVFGGLDVFLSHGFGQRWCP